MADTKGGAGKPALCLQCKKIIDDLKNPHSPFCSKTCKMVDLEGWFTGEYVIKAKKMFWIRNDYFPLLILNVAKNTGKTAVAGFISSLSGFESLFLDSP